MSVNASLYPYLAKGDSETFAANLGNERHTVQVQLASLPELVQMICMNQLVLQKMQPLSPASEFLL